MSSSGISQAKQKDPCFSFKLFLIFYVTLFLHGWNIAQFKNVVVNNMNNGHDCLH